jgi:PHP family Zn ribbon phosphoesterase
MEKYTKIPRETVSRKDCKCSKCGGEIKKGEQCVVDPVKKEARHINC